jgi:hypothetical protein
MNTIRTGGLAMIARLVLVGLVAALGVTLPSRRDCARWMDSNQKWACALLADWDRWEPNESDAYCLPAESQQILSDKGRLARIQHKDDRRASIRATGAEASKSAGHQHSPRVNNLPHDEDMTRSVHSEGMNTEWTLVSPTDQIELAMVIELYRIANETPAEPQKEPSQPDSGSVTRPAVFPAVATQALPNQVFAPEPLRNDNEIENARVLPFPTEVFAPEQLRIEAKAMMVQTLPDDVFTPANPRSEGPIATVKALPDDVFGPTDQRGNRGGSLVNVPEQVGERPATTSQPAASQDERIGEIEPFDPNLDVYCKVVSPLGPDSKQVPTDALGLGSNLSSQPESIPSEPVHELDPGIPFEQDWSTEGMVIEQDRVAMKSDHLNKENISTDVRPPALSSANARRKSETESSVYAKPRVVPTTIRLSAQPELDQALRLTREATSAWMRVLAGPGPLSVTTR